jgi:SAM-dependent methyltransferase
MTFEELKKAIEYYVGLSSVNTSMYISLLTILLSIVSIIISLYTFNKQNSQNIYYYLGNSWKSLLEPLEKYPNYMDITVTENYHHLLSLEDCMRYEISCKKAWGYVEDIISKGFADNEQLEPIIAWVTAYHYTWLRRNPAFFTIEKFWDKIESVRKQPNLIFGYRTLPHKDGDIDWDIISDDYHKYILGPFAPEMVKQIDGQSRNLLLDYLNGIPAKDLQQMSIADFGCGPGNLIPYVAGRVRKLTGIDPSKGALAIARSITSTKHLDFESINLNFLDVGDEHKYDMIISVNSIIPKTREDVIKLFKKIRSCLEPNGRLVAILPSFDAAEYLHRLWKEHYLTQTNNEKHAERVIRALEETKRMNRTDYSYADDGHSIQCYHTPDTIQIELKKSGLRLLTSAKKIYYPWDLARRFDYGYFEDAKEEIWDWFIVAERAVDIGN